jgi:hypothetical protein
LFQHTEAPPISLGWDDKKHVSVEMMAPIPVKEPSNTATVDDNNKLNEHNANRKSRQKKLPANKTDDFYGNFKRK